LSTPELTVESPFLNYDTNKFDLNDPQRAYGIPDEVYERIPQQVLSLLKSDEPRFVVYTFGQSLRPADRSIVTASGFYNICTNYQITGEVAAKAVMRLEEVPSPPDRPQLLGVPGYPKARVVVESYNLLPPD
jgi:hypothetical protein